MATISSPSRSNKCSTVLVWICMGNIYWRHVGFAMSPVFTHLRGEYASLNNVLEGFTKSSGELSLDEDSMVIYRDIAAMTSDVSEGFSLWRFFFVQDSGDKFMQADKIPHLGATANTDVPPSNPWTLYPWTLYSPTWNFPITRMDGVTVLHRKFKKKNAAVRWPSHNDDYITDLVTCTRNKN